jgi:proline iminopeptidase
MPVASLYGDSAPFARHALDVGDGHVLHVQEHGTRDGIAALVLHGGPGSGSTALQRRFLDPRRYRVIVPDQRGAGASVPRGATRANTTAHLLADLRAIRAALDVQRWLVVGGSWGATLAIAHAADVPQAIAGLLLRAVFLARRGDVDAFCAAADLDLPALAAALHGRDAAAARHAARRWWRAEQALSGGVPSEPEAELLAQLIDRYRVQSHYLLADCFLTDPPLLARCARLPRVPTVLLHGRADRICPPEGALAVRQHAPHAALRWIDGAGHDPAHPAMAAAMVEALDGFAGCGDFGPAR